MPGGGLSYPSCRRSAWGSCASASRCLTMPSWRSTGCAPPSHATHPLTNSHAGRLVSASAALRARGCHSPLLAGRGGVQAALMQLWEAAFPEHAFPKGIRSAQWKQMGWQGEDPATDFRQATQLARRLPPATPSLLGTPCSAEGTCPNSTRHSSRRPPQHQPSTHRRPSRACRGGGFLALESLLFLARSEPESFSLLMHKRQGVRSEYEYPFAVAGVNVAFMLTGKPRRQQPQAAAGAAAALTCRVWRYGQPCGALATPGRRLSSTLCKPTAPAAAQTRWTFDTRAGCPSPRPAALFWPCLPSPTVVRREGGQPGCQAHSSAAAAWVGSSSQGPVPPPAASHALPAPLPHPCAPPTQRLRRCGWPASCCWTGYGWRPGPRTWSSHRSSGETSGGNTGRSRSSPGPPCAEQQPRPRPAGRSRGGCTACWSGGAGR